MNNAITVSVQTNVNLSFVWEHFTNPIHIVKWYFAAPDWHAPFAENDLNVGGLFKTRMEAKDGTFGFDFWGTYSAITLYKQLDCVLGDNRKMTILFSEDGNQTIIKESFEPETENTIELQQAGWQAILNNFKNYIESIYVSN